MSLIHFRLPKELDKKLREEAKKKGIPLSKIIRKAIYEHFDDPNREKMLRNVIREELAKWKKK